MIFVTDRTMADVMRAIELNTRIALHGFGALTDAEESEWMGSLKGCMSAADMNRIETNTFVIAENLRANGFHAAVLAKKDWTRNDIPRRPDMERIQAGIAALRSAIAVPGNTPSVPTDLYHMDFNQANNIEKIQSVVMQMLNNTIQSIQRLGTIYSGEGALI